MANAAEQFIDSFHTLEGETIAERKSKFFTLLHQNTQCFKDNIIDLDFIVLNLQPKTFLEELFKVDFLIHFRRSEELYQILKDGNNIFVSKIIKQQWFITEFFGKIDAAELVDNVLPLMSYSVRIKLLGKLSRFLNSEQFELVYNAVEKRYGLFVASKFIYGCTPGKIREVVLGHGAKISSKKLILLYYKDSDLIDFYLSKAQYSSSKVQDLLKFLVITDLELYDCIIKKHNLSGLKFGKHISRKFAKSKQQEIVKNPNDFRHLKTKVVLRKIGVECSNLFCNALPPTITEIDKIQWLLNSLPEKYQYKYYIQILQNHYATTFAEHPKLINEKMMQFFPNNSARSDFAAIKVNNGDQSFLKFLQTGLSISFLKEKIASASLEFERSNYIEDLIKTCHINNDKTSLVEIMKYFLENYHNKPNIHATVAQHLEKHFNLNTFTEEMWKLFDDLLLSKKNIAHYKSLPNVLPLATYIIIVSSSQKLSYFDFLLSKNVPVDELIELYLQTNSQIPTWGTYSKDLEKKILFFAINRCNLESLEANIKYKCSLINNLSLWNLHYKYDPLSVYDFPSLLEAFDFALNDKIYLNTAIKEIFRSKIFTLIENPFRDQYLSIYWKSFGQFGVYKDLKWFLKYDPKTVLKYRCDFFQNILAAKNIHAELQMWYRIKKFSHLKLDQTAKTYYYEKVIDENSAEEKPKFCACLSVLMHPDEYVALANSLKPANKTLNLADEKEVRLYSLQCAVAKHFKYVKSFRVIDSLLHYCAGDFLKYSLKSMYSIFYKTPECLITRYLRFLSRKAVSVRKHALYLTCQLCTVEKVDSILQLLHDKETTPSLRKKLFETSIKYFSKNPSDEFFEIVKLNMLFVNKNDSETLDSMTDDFLFNFPEKYKLSYIEYALDFMEKTIDVENKLNSYKQTLLNAIDHKLCPSLSLSFGLKIIEENLKNDMDRVINKTFSFTSAQPEKVLIMTRIFNTLEECNQAQNLKFFENWYPNILKSAENMPHLELFLTYFSKKIQQSTDFKFFLKLQFLKIKVLESITPKTNFEAFSEKTFNLLNDLISVYGLHITWFFGIEFINIAKIFYNDDGHWEYLYNFFCKYPMAHIAVMILNVIYLSSYVSSPVAAIVNQMIHKMKKIDDPIVKITLNYVLEDYLNSSFFEEINE